MPDERDSATGSGILIAVAVVVVLVICGGGALFLAGGLFFFRMAAPMAAPAAPAIPPIAVRSEASADVLSIESDGSLFWNGQPIIKADLTRHLDQLKSGASPQRPVIVRTDLAAPPGASHEATQLLLDRGVEYTLEDSR